MQEAKSNLHQHYLILLRSQIRRAEWDGAESTSLAYRQAAIDDPQQLLRVATDLAEATKWIPAGRHRDRSVSSVAATLVSARKAGLQVDSAMMLQEPFRSLTDARMLRKVVQP